MFVGGESKVYVDGVDVCEEFGNKAQGISLLLTDETELNPPEKITNYKEIPGMDGILDLSELLAGDVVYGIRQQTLVFFVPYELNFEHVKTQLSNFLDGRKLDYSFSWDPGYTYNGRFRVTEYSGWRQGRIAVEVDAYPYKRGEHKRVVIKAAGGGQATLDNGRKHVIPVITVKEPTLISYGDDGWELSEAGSYTVNGLRLQEGRSVIRANSGLTLCDCAWGNFDYKFTRWSAIPKTARWPDYFFLRQGAKPTNERWDVIVEYDIYDL